MTSREAVRDEGADPAGRDPFLLYDGECPFCSFYVAKSQFETRIGMPLRLIDGREAPDLVSRLRREGYDLEEGMILEFEGRRVNGGGRYVTTPALGFGLTDVEREVSHSWRLAEARGDGLVFGLDIEAVRREPVTGDAGPEHRVVFGLGWQLEGPRRESAALELRLEGAHSDTGNDNASPETLVGVSMTTRW
ncbi:MAG: hypothetical protein OXC15_05725 [Rhodospirillaceae bacterium]|nr:hypothetical protein [Rhodospirillaceae bacterium]